MATTSILPVEIIEFEILSRLPVKSLLRSKSVCKSWYSLICSDVFIKSFRNSYRDSLTLISERQRGKYLTMIIGCINGLVCTEESDLKPRILRFTIQNPATKQCLEMAPPIDPSNDYDYFSGFGFDSVANDYKLMYVTDFRKGPFVGYIYSCNVGCWSKITQSNFVLPSNYNIMNLVEPVLVNGSSFWLITDAYDVNNSRLIVMVFDVRQESFRLLPDLCSSGSITCKNPREFCRLLNFRDSLAVMFYCSELWFGDTIDIHIFNEKCNDWTKTSFGPFKVLSKVLPMVPRFRQCLSNGDILFVLGKELYWVNFENYTIKSLGKGSAGLDTTSYSNYSESLVFINGMKPFYEKEDWFQYFFLKKDHGAANEDMQMNTYVKEKRKRERRSKRSPTERQRICKEEMQLNKYKKERKGRQRSKRNRHDDEEKNEK